MLGSRRLWVIALLALAHAADEAPEPRLDPVRVPKNTTLTYPTSKDSWREAYVQVASELAGRVVAALVFAEEAQAPFIGRVVANVGKILGASRPVFIAAVMDADATTLAGLRQSGVRDELPQVVLFFPPHGAAAAGGAPAQGKGWTGWMGALSTEADRVAQSRALVDHIIEHLDECADDGRCVEELSPSVLGRARALMEQTRAAAGQGQKLARRDRQVKLEGGRAVYEDVAFEDPRETQAREARKKAEKASRGGEEEREARAAKAARGGARGRRHPVARPRGVAEYPVPRARPEPPPPAPGPRTWRARAARAAPAAARARLRGRAASSSNVSESANMSSS